MAVSVTSSGVAISSGRGAAKVILEVSFDALDMWAKKNQVDTERLMKRSFGRACSALKSRFQRVVSNAGGVEGVPKFKDFEQFTKDLRAVRNDKAPMGGVLADKRRIVSFRSNGWQVIGWPDALANWAMKFQDGVGGGLSESLFKDSKQRHQLHRLGLRNVPTSYVHNKRQILPEPFGEVVRKNLDTWARGSFYKDLAKQMQRTAK